MKNTDEKVTEGEAVEDNQSFNKRIHRNWEKQPHHGGNGVLAIILVGLGAIFLLRNFDLLPPDIWENVWKLWPLILIVWGIQLLFGKSWFGNLLVMLVSLVIVYLILSYFNPNLNLDLNYLLPSLHLR